MPAYAVKLGEIQLRSAKPITQEQREAAILMLKGEKPFPYDSGFEVVYVLEDNSRIVRR